ncbi:MAG TPA: universal stress protein [Rubrobacteraceae bacterium]|nr:universal stress protein [Rubrobacteraceae bacterium]
MLPPNSPRSSMVVLNDRYGVVPTCVDPPDGGRTRPPPMPPPRSPRDVGKTTYSRDARRSSQWHHPLGRRIQSEEAWTMSIFPTKVLLATDGSEEASSATEAAVEIAQKTGSELHVVHVYGVAPIYPLYPPKPPIPEGRSSKTRCSRKSSRASQNDGRRRCLTRRSRRCNLPALRSRRRT